MTALIFFTTWAIYGLASGLMRYRLPVFSLLAALMGAAAASFPSKGMRALAGAGLIILSLRNFTAMAVPALDSGAWKTAAGLLSREEYLGHSRPLYPAPPFPAINFINENTPSDAGVILIGEARAYYLERKFMASSIFDTPPFNLLLKKSASGDDLYRRARERGMTHILLNLAEAARFKFLWPPWDERDEKIFTEFWRKYCAPIFEDADFRKEDFRHTLVYEMTPDAPPQDAHGEEILTVLLKVYGGRPALKK